MKSHLIADSAQGFQRDLRVILPRADREHQCVHHQIFLGNAILRRCVHNLLCHGQPPFHRLRNAALVETQTHQHRTIFFGDRKHTLHRFLFAIYRIEHWFSVVIPQPALHRLGIGGIDLQGQVNDRLYPGDSLLHQPWFINLGQSHIDIENLCPLFLLYQSFFVDVFHIVIPQCLFKL